MSTRCDKPPKPGQCRRKDMEQSNDAVGWVFTCARWAPNTKASDIYRNRFVDNVMAVFTRHDDSRVRTSFSRLVFGVFPDERRGVWLGLQVEEQQRPRWRDREFFKLGINAVLFNVIHSDKPGTLCIHQGKGAGSRVFAFQCWVTQSHVISHWVQLTSSWQSKRPRVIGHRVGC